MSDNQQELKKNTRLEPQGWSPFARCFLLVPSSCEVPTELSFQPLGLEVRMTDPQFLGWILTCVNFAFVKDGSERRSE